MLKTVLAIVAAAVCAGAIVGFVPEPSPADAALAEFDRLEASLSAISAGDTEVRDVLAGRARELLSRLSGTAPAAASADGEMATLTAASDDELFSFINTQLGRQDG